MSFDIVTNLLQVLMRQGLSTRWTSTQNKIPVIISSAEQSTMLRVATLTDLPLLQTMKFGNQTFYDFSFIAKYANGVKPDMTLVMYYPSSSPTGNYSATQTSVFV